MITKAPLIAFYKNTWTVYPKADLDLDPDDLYVYWVNHMGARGDHTHFKILFERIVSTQGYPILIRTKTHSRYKELDELFLVENDTDAIQAILTFSELYEEQ